MERDEARALKLPTLVVGKVDIARLLRELESTDEYLAQAAVRQPGTPMQLPRSSRLLEELARENGLNLLQEADRARLLEFLRDIKENAPVIHMSFASDPSPAFTNKLVIWLRREIHPLILLQVGLQPSIAAGCIVRTPNKYFDLSLRQHLVRSRPLLLEKIREAA